MEREHMINGLTEEQYQLAIHQSMINNQEKEEAKQYNLAMEKSIVEAERKKSQNRANENRRMKLAMEASMTEAKQKAAKNRANENRRMKLAMKSSMKEAKQKAAKNRANENRSMELAMKESMEESERKTLKNSKNRENEVKSISLAMKASMESPMLRTIPRANAQDLSIMTLQDKWLEPRFYDELIKRENDKLVVIKRNTVKSIKEALKTKNNNLVKTFENDYKTQLVETEHFLYQFREIQKIIGDKEIIMSMIIGEKKLNTIVRNIIRGLFQYEIGREHIEHQEKLSFPIELSSPTSFIMKTSGNQSDCLIHSILIDISEDFRRLTIEHRNVIAFFFRKIVFPLIPNITSNSKNRLLTNPTLINGDLYLELDELDQIAQYYGLNFMLITNNEINHIPIVAVNNTPYFIINNRSGHFSAVKVNNKYDIPFDLGQSFLQAEAETEINCKFHIGNKIQNKEKKDEILNVEDRKFNDDQKCIEIITFNPITFENITIKEKDFDKYIIISYGGYKSKRQITKKKISKRQISKRKISF
jgi:hypothetical protein